MLREHERIGLWVRRWERTPGWVIRWTLLAATFVVLVPVVLLALAAALVGGAVFIVLMGVIALRQWVRSLFGRDRRIRPVDASRRNVRVIER